MKSIKCLYSHTHQLNVSLSSAVGSLEYHHCQVGGRCAVYQTEGKEPPRPCGGGRWQEGVVVRATVRIEGPIAYLPSAGRGRSGGGNSIECAVVGRVTTACRGQLVW